MHVCFSAIRREANVHCAVFAEATTVLSMHPNTVH